LTRLCEYAPSEQAALQRFSSGEDGTFAAAEHNFIDDQLNAQRSEGEFL